MSRRRTCATRFASSSTWRWPRPATNTTSTTGSWSSAQRSATRPEAGAAGTRANIDRGRGTEMYRVGISGSYGGLNLGDEAILQSIVTQLRRSLPVEITVFSRDVKDTLARHKVERAVPVRDLSRDEVLSEIKGLDLLILGGGGILFDAEAAIYLREVALAEELDVPVLVYAVSAGPLQDPAAQALVRDCLNRAAAVTVRERRARQVLEEVGVRREIEVTADPAILLEPGQLVSLMSHFSFAVGMRLHFLVCAALNRVPFVALPYAGKVLGFLEDLEIEMPPLNQVKAGQLIAHIDRSWDLRRDLQILIDRALPRLQERARRTHAAAERLLTSRKAAENHPPLVGARS